MTDFGITVYLAMDDDLFGTYRIAHRIGGLCVVCGCSVLVCGYLSFPLLLLGFVLCAGALFGTCLGSVEGCPTEAVETETKRTALASMTRYCPYI